MKHAIARGQAPTGATHGVSGHADTCTIHPRRSGSGNSSTASPNRSSTTCSSDSDAARPCVHGLDGLPRGRPAGAPRRMAVQGPGRPFPAWRGSLRGLARTLPGLGSEAREPGPEEDARSGSSGALSRCCVVQAPGDRFLQAPGDRLLADGCSSETKATIQQRRSEAAGQRRHEAAGKGGSSPDAGTGEGA